MKEYVNNNVRIRTIKRISNEAIVGMTGATYGAPLGVALLQAGYAECRDHLVMSKWAKPPLN